MFLQVNFQRHLLKTILKWIECFRVSQLVPRCYRFSRIEGYHLLYITHILYSGRL